MPQARPRARRLPNGQMVVYDPATSRAWKRQVRAAAEAVGRPSWAPDLAQPIGLDLTFTLKRPTSARAGDVDNLAKAVMDALTGWLWEDDRWVVCLIVVKHPIDVRYPVGITIQASLPSA